MFGSPQHATLPSQASGESFTSALKRVVVSQCLSFTSALKAPTERFGVDFFREVHWKPKKRDVMAHGMTSGYGMAHDVRLKK